MTRLARFLAVVAAASLLCTGAIVALATITSRLFHQAATAKVLPLPALGSSLKEGSTVYAGDGTTVLAVLRASEFRKPVQLKLVSKTMITSVLDTEDHRFYLHGGFDLPSTIRALAADSSGSGGLQGGSTITQQLVKQTYLTPARTVSRKIKEAVIADRLERKYSKDQILQAYLNTVYFGNGAYGVEAAALTYFGEHASRLNLAQSALLAGMIQNPSGYDPILQPAAARDRRTDVLSRIEHYGDATRAQVVAANRTPLPTAVVQPPVAADQVSSYYVDEIKSELLGPGSPLGTTYDQRYQALFEGGLKIYTNLDPGLQDIAEQTVANDTPPNDRGFQQALVAIDPTTGKVRAMVGGTGTGSYAHYDIVTQGARQPGSGFKVFTLLAALEQGYSIYDTLDGQSPCAINFPGDSDLVSHPAKNDEGPGGGVMTLLSATAQSINCAYIRLAHEVGLGNVIAMAHRLGVTANIGPYPSIVIGSIPVHPIEMAAAYATVADDGIYHTPTFIDHIVDRSGDTIYNGTDPGHRVVSEQVAREATVAFQAVVQYGTGTRAELYNRQVAGKTGTTDSNADAWFNGFTPQFEATVWMGNVSAQVPMIGVGGVGRVYGGTYPAHTWRDFAAAALANQPRLTFQPMNPRLLPPTKYITSRSLVLDDVLDHNFGYVPPRFGLNPSPAPSPGPTVPQPSPTPVTSPPRHRHG